MDTRGLLIEIELLRKQRDALMAALEPFRHMRVRRDGKFAEADCEILDMRNGVLCVVGYARSGREADEFDQAFERVRLAIECKWGT